MKPSDFKLNTDYLSVATKANTVNIFQFPSMLVFGRSSTTGTIDLDVPDGTNGVPYYMVSLDNSTFTASSYYTFTPTANVTAKLAIYRIGPNLLRASITLRNSSNSLKTISGITVYVREALLTAPDMV